MFEIVKTWKDKNLKNYLSSKNTVSYKGVDYQLDNNSISHMIDWLESDDAFRHRKRLFRMAVPDAFIMSIKWTDKLNKNFKKNIDKKEEGVLLILNLNNGYSIVKLESRYSYQREGSAMSHCSSTYYDRKDTSLYSLRDSENNPHCTIEISNGKVYQIKGKGNSSVSPKYHEYIVEFLNHLDFDNINHLDLKSIDISNSEIYLFKNHENSNKELKLNKRVDVELQCLENIHK